MIHGLSCGRNIDLGILEKTGITGLQVGASAGVLTNI